MALFLQHQDEVCRWAVWKMEETEEELLSILPDADRYREEIRRFSSAHRRLEWIAVRALLFTILGEEKSILYFDNGRPYLSDGTFSLSISHTKGYVAVILGKSADNVGIDIEQYGDRVHKIAHKFVRVDEVPGCYQGRDTWGLLLYWSAKETMFKCLNATEVDFREHLHIFPFVVSSEGVFNAVEYRTRQNLHFEIHYRICPDFVLTYTVC